MENLNTEIESLAKESADCKDSSDALRFSQAALNLAHVDSVRSNTNKD